MTGAVAELLAEGAEADRSCDMLGDGEVVGEFVCESLFGVEIDNFDNVCVCDGEFVLERDAFGEGEAERVLEPDGGVDDVTDGVADGTDRVDDVDDDAENVVDGEIGEGDTEQFDAEDVIDLVVEALFDASWLVDDCVGLAAPITATVISISIRQLTTIHSTIALTLTLPV